MKNLKKILRIATTVLGLTFLGTGQAQNISGHYFGQNAWMPDTIGNANACTDPPCILGGKLHQNWTNIKDSKARLIRFGGIAPDKNMPTNYQYIRMIDAIRANGMEPILQVPYYKGRYNAQQAAAIVQYINITMGKNVKYWVIGNEPDLSYGYTTAQQVASYIKPFASAMKAIDPSILIVGPECAWFNKGIMDGLTTPNGPYDITGRDAAGRTYIDVISFHYYGFNGTQSRNDVITRLNAPDNLQANLVYLNNRVDVCNAIHNRGTSALKTAVTEANVNWQNPATDNLYGVGANSFIGGQFVAEMMATGLKNKVDFINMWSTVEGNNTELNIGYIDVLNGNKKPTYYHFKMMAEALKGTFATGTTNIANVKSFGSTNGQSTAVMIMNQDQGNAYNYTVKLSTNPISGNSPLKINISAGSNVESSGTIPAQSTILLEFDSRGVVVKKTEYSLLEHAVKNLPPTVTNNSPTVTTGLNNSEEPAVNLKGFHIKLYPNPANSKFTIELDRKNPQQAEFDIDIFDIMGRLIFSKKTTFLERVQELDLTGNSLAEAVYIVRVKEAEDKDNVRAEKIVLFK
jgi:hypothetical protein